MRFGDFTTITRSHTVEVPIEHTPDLWDAVQDLLRRVDLTGREVRLLGVGAGGLVAFTPVKALAWFDFPTDVTRFRF